MERDEHSGEAERLKDQFDEWLNDWWEVKEELEAMQAEPDLVALATSIAQRAHQGQTDKAGAPYFGHPVRVANNARILARVFFPKLDENLVAVVALLHDVLEDCPDWTAERLQSEGMTTEIIKFVEALTHHEEEARRPYLERIVAAGLVPTLVKAADLADNSDPKRIAVLEPELQAKMLEKYGPDKEFIGNALLALRS